MNCPRCGALNAAENEFCSACDGPLRATGGASPTRPAARQFRDPKTLTRWLRWLLIGLAAGSAVSLASEIAQYQLLLAIRDGSFPSEADMISAAEANDTRHTAIVLGNIALLIGTMVLFAVWIYRVDSNVHALGARSLRFTPGWAVGWNFVPIANLWKPYQAMSEIWRASKNSAGWQSERTGGLLGWWWFWWITSTLFGNLTGRLVQRAEGVDALISLTPVTIVSLFLDIVSAIFALRVVTQIQGFQSLAADRSLSSVFA